MQSIITRPSGRKEIRVKYGQEVAWCTFLVALIDGGKMRRSAAPAAKTVTNGEASPVNLKLTRCWTFITSIV